MGYRVVAWNRGMLPNERDIDGYFRAEGLSATKWSNGPGDRYSEHSHGYHKVLYCVSGSIVFEVEGESVELKPGDRLELQPGTSHGARVGPSGVVCMEAPK